ncbi:putative bifunctional diguanylate cyclase/phosphodiesterase [Pseudooceanicola sp. MF1-13]|uniref:putative bifunctional diguanylate cyclase/phosphodiesterase n=1 Tax=Pseudooceanicola sp. MF1-13 TaxID=3379095 RepID=UPI003892535F
MTELETALDQFRTSAEVVSGAVATLFLAAPTGLANVSPSMSLGSTDLIARSLYGPGMKLLDALARTPPPVLTADLSAPPAAQPGPTRGTTTAEGIDYDTLCLPVKGPDRDYVGVLAFAFLPDAWVETRGLQICGHLAQNLQAIWKAQENLSDLTYDMMTLSSRATRLQRLSETDALTQLNNRYYFENKVRAALDDSHIDHAFIVIDIDHFKLINDIYGHQFGDRYLKTIARALRSSFPETSIVGRLGGDEFGVFTPLPSSGKAYLNGLLSRCRSHIQRATAMLSKPDLGHVSIGASQTPKDATSYAMLYELADSALYSAKNAGRGKSAVYHPNKHLRYNTAELTQQFHTATQNGDIHPNFQPIIDLKTGQCAAFEVLARWRDAMGKDMIPAQFSTIFRDHALAERMTRTIMEKAFQIYKSDIAPTGRTPRLGLNVTFFDLMNPEFVFEVQSLVNETGFDWSLLTIEVTEQIILDEPKGQILRTLRELRARGAQIAMDDFGTGYGGLRHLADWPIDVLKIDKFFVDSLETGSRARAVLEAILDMAHNMQITVVAEGIETPDQAVLLRDGGCQYGQGFLFDAPLDRAVLASYFQTVAPITLSP